jgi:hypothetical protein
MKKKDLPKSICYICGEPFGHKANNNYLCGKCYLKKKRKERLEKGLK